jgi:hypothetical protein
MPLNQAAQDKFINNLAADLLKKVPNPSREVQDGMEEYAATLYKHISKLILSTTITNPDGTNTYLTLR